ncbi:Na/Pi cotransporter family protein [Aliiroseovarius sp. F47248L]|uniref:Na/Pi cotransporter family protein n=1 Tax=Aliiroseovarius sp. F47248L TaxID=2926420 RepID=UPI001FF46C99|nr:Na/Pi cotransporter family protein [Aliiroseovarius sp. F47248L]MCK0140315.1 Na/Pi cotransporter family protein [Aliiroseovarius sp. F47248L]
MAIVSFVISLAGATMLLLFAVRMVRTGIERSFGASFQRLLTDNRSLIGSSATGVFLAIVLQSSAAVALLATGFAASGYLAFPTGLAIVLGGDLGSALIIQILSFKLDWLVPLLLAVGGWLFVKVESKKGRQFGRILMGVAFILISLQFLREAVAPISDSAFLPAVSGYLARDFVTAFIVGAALAFVMHSSVAAILMCVTLVQIGAIPFAAALSLLLGANMGSAFIPIWLTRGMPAVGRRIPFANLMLRGSWALIVLLVVNLLYDPEHLLFVGPGQSLIYAHIGFNLSLLVLALPFCGLIEGPIVQVFPKYSGNSAAGSEQPVSALDPSALDTPQQAIASLKRELLRMIGQVERMFHTVPQLYEATDTSVLRATRAKDDEVNDTLSGIRSYVATMPQDTYSKADTKTVRGLMEYAIRLEAAGDVIAMKLTSVAKEKLDGHLSFSEEGWAELRRMYEAVCANFHLASNVLVSDDLESARLLVVEKADFKRAERKSRKYHLARLQNGRVESFETSDIHLETLRALRDINNHIAAIAYPILYRNGQLLETRLIEDLDGKEVSD